MGIRIFKLRGIQVGKSAKIGLPLIHIKKVGLNQSLIHIHPFPSTLKPIFLFAILRLGNQMKTILR